MLLLFNILLLKFGRVEPARFSPAVVILGLDAEFAIFVQSEEEEK
jgi:hypothetical protein